MISKYKYIFKKIWARLPSLGSFFYRSNRGVFLFLPINGAGLGHLTRSLAIARRLRSRYPDARIIFLTTSIAVPLVHRAGFVCHHITPAALVGPEVDKSTWNKMFFKSIESVLALHKPDTLVFDGSAPYIGLQRVIHTYKRINYVWIKRGLYKSSIDLDRLTAYTRLFDLVISPGELVEDVTSVQKIGEDRKILSVAPVCLLDKSDLLPSEEAMRIVRVSPDRPRAYVQLGAGNINGIADLQRRVITILRQRGVQVVVGQSPIALKPESSAIADNVIVDYPNSRYFTAFDFALLAGGYNSVCEAVILGLPAIFLPNMETGADDQLKRVTQVQALGPYEVVTQFDESVFSAAVDRLFDSINDGVKVSAIAGNGALQAAELIAGVAG